MLNLQLDSKLKKIEDLVENQHYKNSIEDSLALIEKLLKHLYKEIIISLGIKEKEKLYQYEKKINKSIESMMVGELIGLFAENFLIKKYEKNKKKNFVHFSLKNLNLLNKIRVDCTHKDYESSYTEANLIYFTLRNILNELDIFHAFDLDDEIELSEFNETYENEPQFTLQNLPRPEYIEFIGREDYKEEVLEKLKGRSYIISIDGIGGVGKSALALEISNICWDEQIFSSVIWVSAKKRGLRIDGIYDIVPDISNYNDLLDTILEIYGFEDAKKYKIDNKKARVLEILRSVKTLLIIDNLETVDDPDIFNFLVDIPEPSKILITSRKRLGEVERVVVLKEFLLKETKKFLKVECAEKKVVYDEIIIEKNLEKIHKSTGGIPLALRLIVGWLASGVRLYEILEKLSKRDSELLDFCFNETYNNLLSENSKGIFCIFPIFGGDIANKEQIEAASAIHGEDLDDSLNQLLQLSLINFEKKFDEFENTDIYYYNMLPLTLNFAYIKLIEYKGLEGEARKRLAKYYELHLKPKDAILHYRKSLLSEMESLTEKGKNAVIISNLAFSSYQRGDLTKARKLFRQAVDTDPKSFYSYQLWATLERDQGNYSYAEKLYRIATDLNPKNSVIWSSWAMMKKDLKDFSGAIELLKTGINNSEKKDPMLFQQLAVVESMRGNFEDSINIAVENVIKEPQERRDIWVNTILTTSLQESCWKWARKLFREGKYREGYEKLEFALVKCKDYVNIIFTDNLVYNKKIRKLYLEFGKVKSKGRMYSEADKLMNNAYYHNPKNDYQYYYNCIVDYHKALNYYYWGKRSKTVDYYEKIKNQSTDFPKLKYHTHDLEKKLKISS